MELPYAERVNGTSSRYYLPFHSHVSVTMTDEEYNRLQVSGVPKGVFPAEYEIIQRLLHEAWPTVLEWDLDEDDDSIYDRDRTPES